MKFCVVYLNDEADQVKKRQKRVNQRRFVCGIRLTIVVLLMGSAVLSQHKDIPLLVVKDANLPSLSFDGRRMAVLPEIGASDVYDVDTGKLLRNCRVAGSEVQAISGDGKFVRIFGDNKSSFFEVDSGELVALDGTDIHKDGRLMGSVGLRSFAGSLIKNASPNLDVMAVIYSWWYVKNASPHQPAVIVGRLSDHSLIRSLDAPGGFVKHDIWENAAMTPDVKRVVSERNNFRQPERNVTIEWDVGTGKIILSMPFSSEWFSISDDGKKLVTKARGDAGKVQVWDVPSGRLLSTVDQYIGGEKILISWGMISPDGTLLVTARNVDFYIWDTTTGKLITTQKQDYISRGNVKSIAFSGDGKRIAIGSDTEVVTVWNMVSILRNAKPN